MDQFGAARNIPVQGSWHTGACISHEWERIVESWSALVKSAKLFFQRGCNDLHFYLHAVCGNSFWPRNSPTFAHLMGTNGFFHHLWLPRTTQWLTCRRCSQEFVNSESSLMFMNHYKFIPISEYLQGSILGGLVVKCVWTTSTLIISFSLTCKKICCTSVIGIEDKVV